MGWWFLLVSCRLILSVYIIVMHFPCTSLVLPRLLLSICQYIFPNDSYHTLIFKV